MGKELAPRIAARLGRSLLELGGNNAAIVAPSADLDLVVRGVVFSAVGTAGQRCTTLRRLIVHESVADELVGRLAAAYESVPVGDPRESGTLVGPLITGDAVRADRGGARRGARRTAARSSAAASGRSQTSGRTPGTSSPALVRMPAQTAVVKRETFGPILYVLTYADPDEAIALQNGVPQGLASSIFTTDLREAERFLAASGSRLRDRERQHRPERCRDRRRLRRREGDGRRPRVGLRRVEGVHAPPDRDRQLHERAPARPGNHVRRSRVTGGPTH